jgi:ribosomal-protein-alanine N-acetyltransferase
MIALERECATAAHWSEEQYRRVFEGEYRLVQVADVDTDPAPEQFCSNVVGFLVASHVAGEWELQNVVVDRGARRKGLGMRLLEGLLSHARQSRGEVVFLEVRESNTAARKLYETAGFAQVAMRKGYYVNPAEDAVVYRYSLV